MKSLLFKDKKTAHFCTKSGPVTEQKRATNSLKQNRYN